MTANNLLDSAPAPRGLCVQVSLLLVVSSVGCLTLSPDRQYKNMRHLRDVSVRNSAGALTLSGGGGKQPTAMRAVQCYAGACPKDVKEDPEIYELRAVCLLRDDKPDNP